MEDMLLLVNWATRCGSKVVDLVELLERRSRRRLQLAAFQCIGTLLDDRDLHKVADTLLAEPVCASEGALLDLVTAVCRERWWTWLLLHPDLDPEYIHPANNVFLPLSPCSLCMVSLLIQAMQCTMVNFELLRRSQVKADVRLECCLLYLLLSPCLCLIAAHRDPSRRTGDGGASAVPGRHPPPSAGSVLEHRQRLAPHSVHPGYAVLVWPRLRPGPGAAGSGPRQ